MIALGSLWSHDDGVLNTPSETNCSNGKNQRLPPQQATDSISQLGGLAGPVSSAFTTPQLRAEVLSRETQNAFKIETCERQRSH